MPEIKSTDTHDIRIVKLCVVPKGQPIFSEQATMVEIADEAGGEFVTVTQQVGHPDLERCVAFDAKEWSAIKPAIEHMLGECRNRPEV